MWSRRQALYLVLPALVASCGFEPVYGPGGSGSALYGKVEIPAPKSREDYLFVEDLEHALGRAKSPEYRLSYTIRTESSGQAITSTGDTTRYNLLGWVDYRMTRLSDDTTVAEGRVENFAGYSATGSTVDTLSAERDSVRRLMVILADQTVERLYLTADVGP